MAGLNQIQGGRWDNLLRKFFPIKERSVAPVLAPELVGYVTVQEWEPDMFWARDERLASTAAVLSAVAAELAHWQLFNPVGSNALLIVEDVWLRTTSASQFIDLATLTGAIAGVRQSTMPRDLRFAAVPNIGATVGQALVLSAPPTLGSAAFAQIMPGNLSSTRWPIDLIIPPGESLIVRNVTVNNAWRISCRWRERTAEGTELTA